MSSVANTAMRSQRMLVKNNKNTVSKKGSSNIQLAAKQKKQALPGDTVTLTQSEFDAILGAIGKLSMEKGDHYHV